MAFKIQPYTQKELRQHYGTNGTPVSPRTWRRWLAPLRDVLGAVNRSCFTPKQVQLIVDHLGEPSTEEND